MKNISSKNLSEKNQPSTQSINTIHNTLKKNNLKFTINVKPTTKKNHSQIIYAHGRPMIIPSKQYEQYEKDCAWFLPHLDKPIDYPINLKCIFYMPTKRRVDLCNLQEAVCDMLVHYGILADDNRNIVATMDGSMVLYDKKNPHTDIEISKKLDYNKW